MLKVINLWMGPGAGKSTTAAGLFNLMKHGGLKVELITEVAKDYTYEKNIRRLDHQLSVLAEQDWRQRRLVGEVEWAITDSPLPLQIAYLPREYEFLRDSIWEAYLRYENYDVLLKRTKAYQTYGRNQTYEEALQKDYRIGDLWVEATEGDEDFAFACDGDELAPHRILQWALSDD